MKGFKKTLSLGLVLLMALTSILPSFMNSGKIEAAVTTVALAPKTGESDLFRVLMLCLLSLIVVGAVGKRTNRVMREDD